MTVEIGDWRLEMEIGDLTESGLSKDDDVGDWRLKMEIGDLTGSPA